MSDAANVQSVQALADLKAALTRFASDANEALAAAAQEIQRTLEWLEERLRYWHGEARRRAEALAAAQGALARCEASGSYDEDGRYWPPNCSAEESAVLQARVRLAEAEAELKSVQEWKRLIEGQVAAYQGQAQRLAAQLQENLPKATATLEGKLATLQGYVAISAPTSGAAPTVSFPTTGSISFTTSAAHSSEAPATIGATPAAATLNPTPAPTAPSPSPPLRPFATAEDLFRRVDELKAQREAEKQAWLAEQEAARQARAANAAALAPPAASGELGAPAAQQPRSSGGHPETTGNPERERSPESFEGGRGSRERGG